MSALRVGRAVRVLPTASGRDMTGYIARIGPSTGTHDPLHVRCVALEAGGSTVVLAACELLGLSAAVSQDIQRRSAERAGVPPGNVVVCCTHTHSGPASIHLENCGTVDDRWLAEIAGVIADAAAEAVKDLGPSDVSLVVGRCEAAFNRVAGQGSEDNACRDTEVLALRVNPRDDARPPLFLVNFACHAVSLTEPNRLISADFPFYAQQELRSTSPGLDLVFLQGCCGDLDPVDRGGFDAAERTGRALAAAVRQAGAPVLTGSDFDGAELRVQTVPLRLPLQRWFRDAELQGMIEDDAARRLPVEAEPSVDDRIRSARASYARRMLAAAAGGTLATEVSTELRVVTVGRLVIVVHPFEAFNEVGRAIKGLFRPRPTMVVGYAGGDFGYLPSEKLYDAARYETGDAFLYYGYPGPVARDAAARLVAALGSTLADGAPHG
jgi:neutral ceramidase